MSLTHLQIEFKQTTPKTTEKAYTENDWKSLYSLQNEYTANLT